MLICKLSDQLGNQMFAYAAVKTIALDRGMDFKVYSKLDNQFLKNDTDLKYGSNITSIFPVVKSEIIHSIPLQYTEFQEITTIKSESSMQKEALDVPDNTVMKGHYISPLYFEHRLSDVQKWFAYPKDVDEKSDLILEKIRRKYGSDVILCSVHFRNALDYWVKGYMLSSQYWIKAAAKVLEMETKKVIFVVFYDKMSTQIKKFIEKIPSEVIHESLILDFALISKTDYHIVCNSSFSVMAAIMDKKGLKRIICPKNWPVPKGYFPGDAYPAQAYKIECKRNQLSHLLGYAYPFFSFLKHFFYRQS